MLGDVLYMYCRYCGQPISAEQLICNKCGKQTPRRRRKRKRQPHLLEPQIRKSYIETSSSTSKDSPTLIEKIACITATGRKYWPLARAIKAATNIVFLTGAGISTLSGIQAFRGSGGLYTKNKKTVQNFTKGHYEGFYQHHGDAIYRLETKIPNCTHKLIAQLEQIPYNKNITLITQNFDGLHQKAGSSNIIELHGNIFADHRCANCDATYGYYHVQMMTLQKSIIIPRCSKCGGIIRPDVTFYGEDLPDQPFEAAEKAIEKADLLIIMGTSLTAYPASSLPKIAQNQNIPIFTVNRDELYSLRNLPSTQKLHDLKEMAMTIEMLLKNWLPGELI